MLALTDRILFDRDVQEMNSPKGLSLENVEGNLDVESEIGIILPTYCEAVSVEKLINGIQNLNLNVSILVIDDSSPDGTASVVRGLMKEYKNILLLVRPKKSGLGTAITDGFKAFLSLKQLPNYIITMDADCSHNPKDIPPMIPSRLHRYDLVIGSRYCKGGKTVGWPIMRKLISRCANLIAKTLIRLKVRDCTSGFRCYSTRFVREVIGDLHSQTYEIQIETVKQACDNGFKIKEYPIVFTNRRIGKSKLRMTEFKSFILYILKTLLKPSPVS